MRKRNQRKKVDEEAQRNATQRGRKRNHRNKVNEEADATRRNATQCAEMQEREITEIKSMKRPNATQHNAAWQCEKEKSEKECRRRGLTERNAV